ncbi:MAG: aminomethyl-transferring glycine dehydrogenase [Bacteroidales bacterium]|jgi:glycine dehydrogenase|nr:aminomethyl-transferring glycine dehydrogenase [Bacteroidales bacterium]
MNFSHRHIGPSAAETAKMLAAIGAASIDELIDKTVPASIRLKQPLQLPPAMSESEYLAHLRKLGAMNVQTRSFIGQGWYGSITPSVIQRNILENPGWYTSYTPYQAEISQGRLEALFNYQTVIAEMTGLPLTNASMLDDATAAAEAMTMFFNARPREQVKQDARTLFVDESVFPHILNVIKTRAHWQGINIVIGSLNKFVFTPDVFGAIVQQVDRYGTVLALDDFISRSHQAGAFVGVACDLLALVLLREPGSYGADCAFGSTQRFGLPVGFGGPAAGFFACTETFKRLMPGRIVGMTVDAQGGQAFRLALQTREQHIKRDKATSNICTAQALMAIMNGMYAVYHGADGLREIALRIHSLTCTLAECLTKAGFLLCGTAFFDTLCVEVGSRMESIRAAALAAGINFHYENGLVFISLDETTTEQDVCDIATIFGTSVKSFEGSTALPQEFRRTTSFLRQHIFNAYHNETAMMRYIRTLADKDLGLDRAMIPLGSCTMKLNAASIMFCLSMPEFANIHPCAPSEQTKGYAKMISELGKMLCEITGFSAISLQPNSGAAGEYAGLCTIRKYQEAHGESNRNICLIPASAHGTNPASAAMAGLKVVVVKSTEQGEIDVEDLRLKVAEYGAAVSCLMITYPSTHGVFEEAVREIIDIVHSCGAQVYMDGANMNAQVGLTSPGFMGADVCHLNLHKTFAMPHGGGGPGVGPICCAKHLAEYLPTAVAAAPYGSAFLLPITYGYLRMMGADGLRSATQYAILNANYMAARLSKDYKILYTGKNGFCAHEFILDCNAFSMSADVSVGDMAKRLADYGFHAPTVAFPVHGTLMVEPTESEPLQELDRLIEAFKGIRGEIAEIENGTADKTNNVLKNAPHTVAVVSANEWDKPYSREKAAFPQRTAGATADGGGSTVKYWPSCGRVDDAFGDRNLCSSWCAGTCS